MCGVWAKRQRAQKTQVEDSGTDQGGPGPGSQCPCLGQPVLSRDSSGGSSLCPGRDDILTSPVLRPRKIMKENT